MQTTQLAYSAEDAMGPSRAAPMARSAGHNVDDLAREPAGRVLTRMLSL